MSADQDDDATSGDERNLPPAGQPYGAKRHGRIQAPAGADLRDVAPSRGGGPRGMFERAYGKGPVHLVGHLVVIAITAYVLSIIFQTRFAPRPFNLVLWLLGAAVLHDAVFLPAYGIINALFTRVMGAGDGRSLKELAMGPPAPAATVEQAAATSEAAPPPRPAPTRDQQRRVPLINHVRTPVLLSVMLFLVFLPRILNRQPQNFMNALGHAPPDFFMRWVWVTVGLVVASALLYAVRWVRGSDTPLVSNVN